MRHHEIVKPMEVVTPVIERIVDRSDRSPFFLRTAFSGNLLTLFSLLALATTTVFAQTDTHVRAVRLSNVVGSVQILNGTETQFSQAYTNMPLMQASTLKTGEDGRAEIQFEDGSVARLTPNSSATLGVLSRDSAGNTNTELDLLTGLSYVEMSGAANQRFVVHFGSDEVISPAPVKFRVNLDSNPTELAVLDGTAHLTGGTAYSVDVKANETVRFDASDGTRYFLAQGIDGDSWDQWNMDREQALSQMGAQETRQARADGNPNDPAWSDLDYYGNWYSAPDGSQVWAPNGAGAGWDPYGSGSWGYYGGVGGYVWISGYPWGWLPYHCGAWSYYNSFGWGWAPGGCYNQWYPLSAIVYAPAYYRPIQRPIIGHVPVHGPVNLAGTAGRPLIHVDRGAAATQINPHAGPAPRTVTLNGQPAQLLAKTAAPANSFAGRPGASAPGRGDYGGAGGQLSTVPVYRPAAPSYGGAREGYAPTYAAHASGGGQVSAPHYSAPAASASGGHASAPSAPSAGGGASSGGGGGHVK
jgi:hypothetical protein